MKLLAATVLLAAFVPAMPSTPSTSRPTAETLSQDDCTHAHTSARLRPGVHGHRDRNELTPGQAETVERQLNRILRSLGLGPADETSARRSREHLRTAQQISIPVHFHVLHDGANGNVSDALVERQISTLNDSYGGRNGGADTRISFELREVTRTDNAAWFKDPERYEATYKPTLRKGDKGTLNLYSADTGSALLGWSTFPWKYEAEPNMDGVTVHYGSMPGAHIENFNKGFSATHEVGHWLGLYHTFQDGCGGEGDRVADTPDQRDPTHGCPSGKDTCPSPGLDPVNNYMDYSYDTCMTSFTAGQGSRMHKVWTAYRR